MSTLAKLYTWTPGQTILSAQVAAEIQQLIDLLAGTSTTKEASIKLSATSPVLTLNQQSTGAILEAQASGVAKLRVLVSGQLESLLATGTAPFSIASTTKVPNLNADQLDGFHDTSFLKSTGPSIVAGANASLTFQTPATATKLLQLIRQSTDSFIFHNTTDAVSLFTASLLNNDITFTNPPTVPTPTASGHASTKAYVDGRTTAFSASFFFSGTPTTALQPEFIVPGASEVVNVTQVKILFRNGTATGDSTFKVSGHDTDGTELWTHTITLLTAATADETITDNITDHTLTEGQRVRVANVTSGGHQDVTLAVQGTQEIV